MHRLLLAGLLWTALASLAVLLPPTEVIYVDDDAGPWQTGSPAHPFAEIQTAIDAAPPGATVRVAVGYYSPFVLTKPLHLQGAGLDNARIASADGSPSLVSGANGAVVEGFTFLGGGADGAPAGEGLSVENSAGVLVLSCKFPFFATALAAEDSEVTLAASILEYGTVGVYLHGSVLHASANLMVNNGAAVDCDAGEVDSWTDYLAGNLVDIADSCARAGY